MSKTVSYEIENFPIDVPSHNEGAIVSTTPAEIAEMKVTGNYYPFFAEHLGEGGIDWLYGKKGSDVLDTLEKAITELGTEQDPDYWAPTPGNAGYALSVLLSWVKVNPNAVFRTR